MTPIRHAVATAMQAAARQTLDTNLSRSSMKGAMYAFALSLGLAGTVYAADEEPAPADQNAQKAAVVEEITITGSRIKRTTDFDTATPTTVVDSSYLNNLGIVNVGQAIAELPSNISNDTPTTTGNANFFTGSTIAN